jgi:phage protein U
MSLAPAISPEYTDLDEQHPWPGLESFTENDCEYFYGRDDETADLFRLVKRDTLTVLFGSSGLGKTSLLKAGLSPKLIEAEFLPIYLRLTHSDASEPLADQVRRVLEALIDTHHVDAPKPLESEALSAYFHRKDVDFWGIKNRLLIPVLVFDQFEEIFTLGRENAARRARAKDFFKELADLVERRPPTALKQKWESGEEEVTNFCFERERCKIILSLREEYLSDLEGLRPFMRSVMRNRLRIRPMNGENAFKVVVKPAPGLVDNEVATHLVQLVANSCTPVEDAPLSEDQLKELEVDPALLSLVCRELNARRITNKQPKITSDLLRGSYHDILKRFYNESVANLPEVSFFIEDRLLTGSGYRTSVALEDALAQRGITQEIIDRLVRRRLLRIEDRLGVRSIELTHDILTPVVRESRDSRRTSEARVEADRLRRKQRITAAVAGALALSLIATVCLGYYFFFQEHEDYYREFTKKNGFPLGIGPLSKLEARSRPVSFVLVKKGIVRRGWKLHWKPAFRVVAVDSLLKPTTHHSVGTYLWEAQRESEFEDTQDYEPWEKGLKLGLQNVCQWEFVSTAKKGESLILYERGLDRDGRMVYGLIYSPLGKESGSTRLARYVGPNGFPQLQRRSVAEYVLIHYDKNGWEDRIMYRDGKNQPAIGPAGAFGTSMVYNDRGQRTLELSLDAHEHNMIDNAGNCGMEDQYDAKGRITEGKSLGPDLRPMSLKHGVAIYKYQNDEFGRVRRETFHGVNGEPVLHKDGYHGWEAQYDERGNQIVLKYIGLDGKPTLLADGYAIMKSTYDARGNMTGQSYHGVNGEPVQHRNGYHGWEAQYDERGNQIVLKYIGLDGKPTLLADGFATGKSTYDPHGKMTRVTYHGVNGEPVQLKDGYHGWQAQYDKSGNQKAITYLGLGGNPVVLPLGFAVVRSKYDSDGNQLETACFDAAKRPTLALGFHKRVRVYDARGKETRRRYYGVKGEPVQLKDGSHGWEAQYDERGNPIATTFVGLDGKPTLLADGYAIMKFTYDAHGKETRRSYHGVNGEPVQLKDGYHGWEAQYNKRGNLIAMTFVGLDGKPSLLADGFATGKSTYDARGKETRRSYYGIDGEPVQRKDGFHGWEAQYNERGNLKVLTYLGLDGKPTLFADGFAVMKSTYDARGNRTGQSYYGVNGEPVVSRKDGYHGWEVQYDERWNPIATTFVGLDGKPTLLADGYAMMKSTYDARGNMTGQSYHGVNGEPVVSRKDGYHGWEAQYDERWNPIATTFVGLDGKPALLADGYATLKSTYDARGKEARRSYHGVNGEPVVSRKEACHGWEAQYDARGNLIAMTFVGLDGKPSLLVDGYATLKSTYDACGKEARRSYHGVNGEPVVSRKEACHGWEAQYDERGKQIAITYLGLDGKPTLLADGYATLKSTYDPRGNMAGQSYHGVNGEAVVSHKEGYHSWEARYDWRGKQVDKILFGKDGKPRPTKLSYDTPSKVPRTRPHRVSRE